MPELDAETLARALRWCSAAGRPATEVAVRAALEPLTWDELLAVKATLADPPPRGDLGPSDLVALSRGARRAGRPPPPTAPAAPAGGRRRGRGRPPRGATAPRIRRASQRSEGAAAAEAPLPLVDGLFREEGRADLERLLRRIGPSRPALTRALAAGWRRPDGAPVGERDLDLLLAHHGLARSFAERERALVLHTLRKRGGVRPDAASDLGLEPSELDQAVARLGLGPAVEVLRANRRRELLRRATLAERARMFAVEEPALVDLGILAEVESDLRRRLPEHLRAIQAAGKPPPLGAALAESLGLPRAATDRLAERLSLDVASARPPGGPPPVRRGVRGERRSAPGRPGGRPPRGGRPAPQGRRRRPGAL
ncbi:MAG TPA: hypothetical protein VMT17_01330 [Anaeromyxobacteraceae bacterium]|nr:hypothetical protein [Anaeromyxobacteraceae bacterium]